MVSFGLSGSYSVYAGIALILAGFAFGLLALILVFRRLWGFRTFFLGLFQDIALAIIYLMCGFTLFFQGWRQDPSLQVVQCLLVITTLYLDLKDKLYRFRR